MPRGTAEVREVKGRGQGGGPEADLGACVKGEGRECFVGVRQLGVCGKTGTAQREKSGPPPCADNKEKTLEEGGGVSSWAAGEKGFSGKQVEEAQVG